jgi:hypothetical protein
MMTSLYQALKSVARGVRALSSAIVDELQIEDFRLKIGLESGVETTLQFLGHG